MVPVSRAEGVKTPVHSAAAGSGSGTSCSSRPLLKNCTPHLCGHHVPPPLPQQPPQKHSGAHHQRQRANTLLGWVEAAAAAPLLPHCESVTNTKRATAIPPRRSHRSEPEPRTVRVLRVTPAPAPSCACRCSRGGCPVRVGVVVKEHTALLAVGWCLAHVLSCCECVYKITQLSQVRYTSSVQVAAP